jgi:hypothetical protein
MKELQGLFNPEASRIVESLKSGRDMILDQTDIAMMMLEGQMEPGSFDEFYNHSDLDLRIEWRSSIDKEFKKVNLRGVWEKINKSEIHDASQCVKSKWVFKIKRNQRKMKKTESFLFIVIVIGLKIQKTASVSQG